MIRDYLVDTNHLSEAIEPVSVVREQLHLAYRRGVQSGTLISVIGELEAGIQRNLNSTALYQMLDIVLRESKIWQPDRTTARIFGKLRIQLKDRGRPISHVDVLLAAYAFQHKKTLLTADKDFHAIPKLRTENWLK